MISFKIPFRLPSLNEYIDKCRGNRYGGASFKKGIENDIMLILGIRHFLIAAPVNVTFIWHEPNKRRDKDNVAFEVVYDGDEGVEVVIENETH